MIRNLKVLGLALVAMFAMSALVASAAQAQTSFTLTGDAGTTQLDSHGANHLFTLSGGRSFTCKTITSTNDAVTLPTSTVTAKPVFSECTSKIAGTPVPVTVTMNECDFLFHLTGTDPDGNSDHYVGDVGIVCPVGKSIDIHVYPEGTLPSEHATKPVLCTYTVGSQTVNTGVAGAAAITYDIVTGAVASEDDINITANAINIAVTKVTGTIANCGGASQTGTYVGTSTVTGTTSLNKKTGIRLSD
jgi:hypothetical protein